MMPHHLWKTSEAALQPDPNPLVTRSHWSGCARSTFAHRTMDRQHIIETNAARLAAHSKPLLAGSPGRWSAVLALN